MTIDKTAVTAQYEALPAEGMHRYWMSVCSWLEDWPEDTPFHHWMTGSGSRYRSRPSKIDTPIGRELTERLKEDGETVDGILRSIMPQKTGETEEAYDDRIYEAYDEYAISDGMVCMLVDAVDVEAAHALVEQYFPDMERRFCELRMTKTLTGLASTGRFQHPAPQEEEAPAPTI